MLVTVVVAITIFIRGYLSGGLEQGPLGGNVGNELEEGKLEDSAPVRKLLVGM